MERSEEYYEPIILDLQKSQAVQRPKRYILFIGLTVVFLGTLAATFAALYYSNSLATHRFVERETPVPELTPPVSATPTLVPAIKHQEPTPTAQPTVTATEATGTLNLYSHPAGAEVVIDEKLLGRTPLLNYELKPGTYTVKFTHQGKISKQKITITAGKTTEYTHRFEGFGSLHIRTTRSGSDIFVNGELAGKSPLLLEGLSSGTYKIVARKPGYATAEKTVTLKEGEHQEVLITIKRLDLVTEPDRKLTPTPPRPIHPSERLQQ